MLETVNLSWVDEDGDQVSSKVWAPCDAPVKATPKALEMEMDLFKRAWFDSGAELSPVEQLPYVSSAALERFLVSSLAMRERKAKRELDPTKDGLLGRLASKGVIEAQSSGWVVCAEDVASTWAVGRGAR